MTARPLQGDDRGYPVDVQVVQLAPPVLIRRAIAHYNARLALGKRPAEATRARRS